ncbi:MAG: hypothetical protein V3R16_08050 [Nitrospirales bacterium]
MSNFDVLGVVLANANAHTTPDYCYPPYQYRSSLVAAAHSLPWTVGDGQR